MVPYNNHDFSQDSVLTGGAGVTKIAVMLAVALFLLFFMLMVFSEYAHETECPKDNSIEYEDCILPD